MIEKALKSGNQKQVDRLVLSNSNCGFLKQIMEMLPS